MSSALPDLPQLVLYLDANVVFSACYAATSDFLHFWKMKNVEPVTSLYAIEEVRRNIRLPVQAARFDELIARTRLVSDANPAFVPPEIVLARKDRPILAAAIAASVDYLVTGDLGHFTPHYETSVSGVKIIRPKDFLRIHAERLAR